MSELLRLASALRKAPDEQIIRLLNERMLQSHNYQDFFDLAEALSSSRIALPTVASLPRSQVEALREIEAGQTPKASVLQELQESFLVSGGADAASVPQLYESTRIALNELQMNAPAESALLAVAQPRDQAEIDRDCANSIFDSIQAITELIFDLEVHRVREVGRRSVGLPDIKRLAGRLRQSNDYVREIYELANFAGVIALVGGRWQLTGVSDDWITEDAPARWQRLAGVWLLILGRPAAIELASMGGLQVHSLGEILGRIFPLADSKIISRITKLLALAEHCGISHAGNIASWVIEILKGNSKSAANAVMKLLPAAQSRLIVQADLTLIAPGPLETAIEIKLRQFAELESIGTASSYRISALSISHGYELGMTEDEIRDLLTAASQKELPQPVDYLLREASARFGRLKVLANIDEGRTEIHSADPILIKSIENDSKLRPFNFRETAAGFLVSRLEANVVYLGLREAGYSAIRVSTAGQVLSPRTVNHTIAFADAEHSPLEDIARWRAQDERVGGGDDDDLSRHIQLAIKNKARLNVTVRSASGDELQFLLDPIGVANGRLRAKDRKADIERTLPMTSIIHVEIA